MDFASIHITKKMQTRISSISKQKLSYRAICQQCRHKDTFDFREVVNTRQIEARDNPANNFM